MRWSLLGRLGSGLIALLLILGFSRAPSSADEGPGVARISVVNGGVSMQHGASGGSLAAFVNAPVAVGDYLSTARGARAEIQLDNFTFVRVDSYAQLRFTQLDPSMRTLQLAAGTVELRTFPDVYAGAQVQTPSATIRPSEAGRYRITVTNDGSTLLGVRAGSADVIMPQGTETVVAGYSVEISGPPAHPYFRSIGDIAYDGFDGWNSDRDQIAELAFGNSYASTGITGLADLDEYGSWMYDAQYGEVWVPNDEAVGWAPYHYGRWAWQPYWGWTWVGYEPWGWAPYHYGRWFYRPIFGWAWYPGPAYYAPVWQPALVAFFGCGGGFGFNFAFGNIGWVPLGPFEPFYPWWGRFARTRVVYNITNINIINVYRNAGAPGGVAVVRAGTFQSTKPYRFIPVHDTILRSVTLAKGGLPVKPSTQSMAFGDRAGFTSGAPISPRFRQIETVHAVAIKSTIVTKPEVLAKPQFAPAGAKAPVTAKAMVAPAVVKNVNTDAWSRFGGASHNDGTATTTHVTMPAVQDARKTFTQTAPVTQHAPLSGVWSRFDNAPAAPGAAPTMHADQGNVERMHTGQTATHTYTPSNWWSGYNNDSGSSRSTTQTYGNPQSGYSPRTPNDPYRSVYSTQPHGWSGQSGSQHPSSQGQSQPHGSNGGNGSGGSQKHQPPQ